MLVDIDKIIVGDRIRRDFGDIQELAEDIRQNSLLNALVVTPNGEGTYLLIAGERRLRAMRDVLGYKAVPVNVVGVEDAEQALMMEISENECRKEFTKTERLEYARRLAAIEAAKAKGRMKSGKAQDPTANLPQGETREIVAMALDTSATQLRREQFIADHADLLDPADFADWDEGRLSTNRAFQRVKAAQAQAERERDEAETDAAELRRTLCDLRDEVAALESQNDALYEQANTPQVVERRVEVAPSDYADAKRQSRMFSDENARLRRQLEETRRELDRAKGILGMGETAHDVRRDVQYLISATNAYVRQYGGLTWTAASLASVDAPTLDELRKAVTNLATFSSALVASLEETNGNH